MVVARAALARRRVPLERRVAGGRDGRGDRLLGQRRAPEVGVEGDAGRVDHPPQRGAQGRRHLIGQALGALAPPPAGAPGPRGRASATARARRRARSSASSGHRRTASTDGERAARVTHGGEYPASPHPGAGALAARWRKIDLHRTRRHGMARATPVRPLLDERLTEMLALIEGADSVELKLTVPDVEPALGRSRARDGPARRPDPAGLLLRHARPRARQGGRRRRARAACRGRATTPSSSCARSCPASCPAELRASPSFGVEVDAMPGGFVCSGSLKARRRTTPRSGRRSAASGRCASSSPRSSAPCSPSTRPRASRSTTSPSSGRSSCSS